MDTGWVNSCQMILKWMRNHHEGQNESFRCSDLQNTPFTRYQTLVSNKVPKTLCKSRPVLHSSAMLLPQQSSVPYCCGPPHDKSSQMLWLPVRQLCWLRVHQIAWPWGKKKAWNWRIKIYEDFPTKHKREFPIWCCEHCFGCCPGKPWCLPFQGPVWCCTCYQQPYLDRQGMSGGQAGSCHTDVQRPLSDKDTSQENRRLQAGYPSSYIHTLPMRKGISGQPLYRPSSFIFLEIKIYWRKRAVEATPCSLKLNRRTIFPSDLYGFITAFIDCSHLQQFRNKENINERAVKLVQSSAISVKTLHFTWPHWDSDLSIPSDLPTIESSSITSGSEAKQFVV